MRKKLLELQKQVNEMGEKINQLCREAVGPEPTVESVYGKPLSELKPPRGYRFTGEFCSPSADQYCLSEDGLSLMRSLVSGEFWGPRLIVRKCKRLVLDVLDENAAPGPGQWSQPREQGDIIHPVDMYVGLARYVLSRPRIEED